MKPPPTNGFKRGDPNHPSKTGRAGRRAGYGRKKGTPNKITVEQREFFAILAAENQGAAADALKRLLKGGKYSAGRNIAGLGLYATFNEFVIPKLQRTEHTGADGKDLPPPVFAVSFAAGAPGLVAPGRDPIEASAEPEPEPALLEAPKSKKAVA